MSHATISAALSGYLTTAAATMSSPSCSNVIAGEPPTINRATVAYWFIGIRPWDGNTLDRSQEEWGWRIRVYLPLGTQITPPREQAELWVANLASAIRSQLWGHTSAGGQATGNGIELGDATAAYTDVSGVTCRIVDMDWWAQMANVATIAR